MPINPQQGHGPAPAPAATPPPWQSWSSPPAAPPAAPPSVSGVPAVTGTPYDPTTPAVTTTDQISGAALFAQTLQSLGFDATDAAALQNWATQQITGAGAPMGLPVPEAQVALNLKTTPQYAARFPGIIAQRAAGVPVTSEADYISYENQMFETAQQAGLPQGFLTRERVGQLIAGHVDPQEFGERVTKGYQAVAETTPEVRAYFKDKFGVGPGDLAAYFLDPANAEPLLIQKATASQIGGAGMVAGFHELNAGLTLQAAQMGVSAAQGTSALTGETATQLALTRPSLGQPAGPGTVSEDTLASSALIGDETSRRAVQLATETRKAPFGGGGGYVQQGAGGGVGAASTEGGQARPGQ